VRRRAARGKSGFTLLEMIVATSIMGIAVAGLMSGISGATRNAARLRDYDRAVQLASLKMNELLLDPRLPRNGALSGNFDPSLSGGADISWQAHVESFERAARAAPGQMSLDRIQLQISWMSGRERRNFTLDAFRPYTLQPGDLSPGVSP